MRFIILLALSMSALTIQAQTKWVNNRQPFEIEASEEKHPLLYLYKSVDYDFKYDNDDQYVCDITYHVIVRAINDDALEQVNQIYITVGSNVIDILDIKSRSISPAGKIIELDQNDIKEIKDETSENGYRIFAVEGAEIGGEIEYMYTKRVRGSTFVNEKIQRKSPIKRYEFSLQSPESLEYEFVTVNDTTKVMKVDTSDIFNQYAVAFDNIPAFVDETISASDANIKRIDFKLAYNTGSSTKRLNTYSSAGKSVYNSTNTLTKSETKALDGFIKKYDRAKLDKIDRFKNLEHEAKKELNFDKSAPSDLDALIANKLGSEKAFLKLMVGILNELDIKNDIVVTSGRFETKFNPNFDSWNYLDEYLIYLPEYDTFVAPHSMTMRYGYVPARLTATKGIFVSNEHIKGDYYFPVTRIDYIPETDYTESRTDLEINVVFDGDIISNRLEVKRTYYKKDAFFLKASLLWLDDERKEEQLERLVRYLAPDAEIIAMNIEKENTAFNEWNEPLVMTSTYKTEAFIEQAGDVILFKIGEVIGAQSQLYQEKERQYPVENLSNHGYHDDIIVQIPKGYTIQNPEDLNLDKYMMTEGERVCSFTTKYQIDGQQLKISLDEFYNQILIPAQRFDEYRSVINAAADWNKVVLVLNKK